MKFKLLYDDWVRTHPLKRSNQPVITSFNTFNNNNKNNKNKITKENNNNNVDEYGDNVDVTEEELMESPLTSLLHSPSTLIIMN
jgi:hypothetical protein